MGVTVSVCMTTYNGEKYVRAQLDSILAQLSAQDELIVCDDGSTDGTVARIDSYGDPRIKLYRRQSGPSGVVRNSNAALRHAAGQFVFLADQDDVWDAGKIETMVGCLAKNHAVVCDCSFIDKEGAQILPSFFAVRGSGRGFLRNLTRNGYMGCCLAVRKELLRLCLPIPRIVPMHDLWIGLLAEAVGRTQFLNRQLVQYRCHDRNFSPTATGARFPFRVRLGQRALLLGLVAQRLLSRRCLRLEGPA